MRIIICGGNDPAGSSLVARELPGKSPRPCAYPEIKTAGPRASKPQWRAGQRDSFARTVLAASLVFMAMAIVAYAFARFVP